MAKNIEMQYYNGSSYEICYPKANMTNVTGILSVDNGGTGTTRLDEAGDYAIIRKAKKEENGSHYLWYTNTANGAYYATEDNSLAKFGTLPVA